MHAFVLGPASVWCASQHAVLSHASNIRHARRHAITSAGSPRRTLRSRRAFAGDPLKNVFSCRYERSLDLRTIRTCSHLKEEEQRTNERDAPPPEDPEPDMSQLLLLPAMALPSAPVGIAVVVAVCAVAVAVYLFQKNQKLTASIRSSTDSSNKGSSTESAPSTTNVSSVDRRQIAPKRSQSMATDFSRKFVLVGGKGGVGKTTTAASIALHYAEKGEQVLVISTDPAHSLSDSFDMKIRKNKNNEPVPVEGTINNNLYCLELDPEQSKGLEGTEFSGMFDTLPPGFDETMALTEIIKITQDDEYRRFDRVVIDTAPTGHTLRLLSMPTFLDGFIGKLMGMAMQFTKQFGGMMPAGDNSMESLESFKEDIKKISKLLRDPKTTEFVIVTTPAMMVISETERLAEELIREGIACKKIVINQIVPATPGCRYCTSRAREHDNNIAYMRKKFSHMELCQVEAFQTEVRGIFGLRLVGDLLFASTGTESSSSSTTTPQQPSPSSNNGTATAYSVAK